jgi:hypothetical protein
MSLDGNIRSWTLQYHPLNLKGSNRLATRDLAGFKAEIVALFRVVTLPQKIPRFQLNKIR